MTLEPLPFRARLCDYEQQAEALLDAWRAQDAGAIGIVRHRHPRFVNPQVPWLPANMSDEEVQASPFDLADARLTVARVHDFQGWEVLQDWVEAVARQDSPVSRFESAVQTIVEGEVEALGSQLRADPALVRARSTRVTHFDPPVHRATLLHYVAANGVEGQNQKTPPTAVDVARRLLDAGAEVDALADMYGGQHTTMCMLVSSGHPAAAGLQVALVDTLADYGASVNPFGRGDWTSPLLTALAFGYADTADALVRRGARVETLAAAAGLGRVAESQRLLGTAAADERHRAVALSAQLGRIDVLRLLLDAGEDPSRYNPKGNHAHSTPLHQAVWSGHEAVVRLLVERGARLDVRDTVYGATPLGWADYGGRTGIAGYLRSVGAT
jgi:ankyrin repeat protein